MSYCCKQLCGQVITTGKVIAMRVVRGYMSESTGSWLIKSSKRMDTGQLMKLITVTKVFITISISLRMVFATMLCNSDRTNTPPPTPNPKQLKEKQKTIWLVNFDGPPSQRLVSDHSHVIYLSTILICDIFKVFSLELKHRHVVNNCSLAAGYVSNGREILFGSLRI